MTNPVYIKLFLVPKFSRHKEFFNLYFLEDKSNKAGTFYSFGTIFNENSFPYIKIDLNYIFVRSINKIFKSHCPTLNKISICENTYISESIKKLLALPYLIRDHSKAQIGNC